MTLNLRWGKSNANSHRTVVMKKELQNHIGVVTVGYCHSRNLLGPSMATIGPERSSPA